MLAISQHGNIIRNLEDLVHLVSDVNNRDTLRLERANHAEKMSYFAFSNGRGRFIHDDQTGVVRDRFGNFNHLGVGNTQVFHDARRINIDFKSV